jgi:magnesium-transporting ATPase (P-type)
MWQRMALLTPTIVAVTLAWFTLRLAAGNSFSAVQTETITLLAVCEWFNVLNCLSDHRSALRFDVVKDRWLLAGLVVGNVLQLCVVYVPALNEVFHTTPIPLREAIGIGAAASCVLWVEEIRKLIVRLRKRAPVADTTLRDAPHAVSQ